MRGVLEERREHVGVAPDRRRRAGRSCRFPRAAGVSWHAAMLDGDVREPNQRGFVVLHRAVPPDETDRMSRAYDAAIAAAAPEDVRIGSTTTRVNDFVNRGEEFDAVYVFQPLLDACELVIGRPFKLSSFHARTLRPLMPAQDLHVDVN